MRPNVLSPQAWYKDMHASLPRPPLPVVPQKATVYIGLCELSQYTLCTLFRCDVSLPTVHLLRLSLNRRCSSETYRPDHARAHQYHTDAPVFQLG